MRKACLLLLYCLATQAFAAADSVCPTMRVAGAQEWIPFSYVANSDSEQITGIAQEVVKLIAADLGVGIKFVTGMPWKRIETELTQGKLDILAGNYWTREREEKWLLTVPIATEAVHLFTLAGKQFEFTSLKELRHKRGVVPQGISLGKDFDTMRKQLDVFEVRTHEQMYEMLHLGRVDYLVSPRFAARTYLQKPANRDVVMLARPINHYAIHLSLSRQSPCAHLISPINDIIEKHLADGTIRKIVEQYTGSESLI